MYDKLVVIEEDNTFFNMNTDKTNLVRLVGKHIVVELRGDRTIEVAPAKLLSVSNNRIVIEKYNDGNEETAELWKDSEGKPNFIIEEISFDNIRGIEEYTKCSDLVYRKEYDGKVCKLINKNDDEITVLMSCFDGVKILFENKYQYNGEIRIGENEYFLYYLKDIVVVD